MYLVNAIMGDSDDLELLLRLCFTVFVAVRLRLCLHFLNVPHHSASHWLTQGLSPRLVYSNQTLHWHCTRNSLEHWAFGSCSHSMGVWQIKTELGVNTTQGREAKHVQISSYERIARLNTVGIRFSGTITPENFGYLSVSHPYLHIINRETALSLIVSP